MTTCFAATRPSTRASWTESTRPFRVKKRAELRWLPGNDESTDSTAIGTDLERDLRALPTVPDWDDNGADPIAHDRIAFARAFATVYGNAFLEKYGRTMPRPMIGPCPDGSIDFYWRGQDFTLLVNVSDKLGYYGEEKSSATSFKGMLDGVRPSEAFLAWLGAVSQ